MSIVFLLSFLNVFDRYTLPLAIATARPQKSTFQTLKNRHTIFKAFLEQGFSTYFDPWHPYLVIKHFDVTLATID